MEWTTQMTQFCILFFMMWFIASFALLMLHSYFEERRTNYADFTRKDLFIWIAIFPLGIGMLLGYAIAWVLERTIIPKITDKLSDWMNTPLVTRRKNKDE